ncbi:F-box/kelch-repeat protein At3g23880-like [Phragmites australis]|uniref:F-box/kelch-repeat protein At3g23880-like n=1 Tax=Phragmites australis TaxID=29695 RepID=UPI002D77CBB2|nr:F-box/kelch-repeat protein At3g23880-like [Phragmites australis]XP_062181775.1 F-box/kelch-repeat protein At3g23880-like [Phragmites australis]
MASSRPCAGPDRHVVPTLAASGTGVLPLDAVYEILLRVPAKALCRLRTVSQLWRVLLSDPWFAAAHAARHPEPLFIAAYFDELLHAEIIDIMDLSGQIVKRVRVEKDDMVLRVAHDLVCVLKIVSGECQLLNPVTGAVHLLPNDLAEEHTASRLNRSDYDDDGMYLFGQVASMREYKVLRILERMCYGKPADLCEVCTLDSGTDARWRAKQAPPDSFVYNDRNSVVIDGVVYLTSWNAYLCRRFGQIFEQDWIIPFDLEKEEWMPNIQGPQVSFADNGAEILMQLTLANLNGSLAVVHGPAPYTDIWILMDFQKGLWVKQYSIHIERQEDLYAVHPLLVLDDGRIVIHREGKGLLQIHDPRTNTSTNLVEKRHCDAISIYAGNLMSLEW